MKFTEAIRLFDLHLGTERNVVKIRGDAPLELMGPLGCGIQTGAGAIINTLGVGAGQSVAVFGVGSVGLSAIMAARLMASTAAAGEPGDPDGVGDLIHIGRIGAVDVVGPREGHHGSGPDFLSRYGRGGKVGDQDEAQREQY